MKNIILALVFLVPLSSCVTPARQTDVFLNQPHAIPERFEIPNVPFVQQSAGYCGPATLTMVMNWAGKNADVNDVASHVYNPKMHGSLQTDLITASRRHGLVAVPIEGLDSLLSEVAAGHPVIIFENLALSWLPQYHYAVVFGYDLPKEEIIMHSGPEAFKHWDLRKFERSWMLGDYWGLVVLPPDQLTATGDEVAHLTAASGLEQVEKQNEAGIHYQKILSKWPRSFPGMIGAANVAFAKRDFLMAVRYLRKAAQLQPSSPVAWHNLAVAEKAARLLKEASMSARKALALAPENQKSAFQENLKDIL